MSNLEELDTLTTANVHVKDRKDLARQLAELDKEVERKFGKTQKRLKELLNSNQHITPNEQD